MSTTSNSLNTHSAYTQIRRRDRAVEDEDWIHALLRRAPVGALATVNEDGQPFINTNLFVYDSEAHAIYLHTARVGRTRANVALDERVCFSVGEMGRLLPADTALEFSVEYGGVTVFGRGSIVGDEGEAARALQLLLDKYAPHLRPGRDYRPIQPEELVRTTVYRIAIAEWSGKRKAVPADFPGAYRYEELRAGAADARRGAGSSDATRSTPAPGHETQGEDGDGRLCACRPDRGAGSQ